MNRRAAPALALIAGAGGLALGGPWALMAVPLAALALIAWGTSEAIRWQRR